MLWGRKAIECVVSVDFSAIREYGRLCHILSYLKSSDPVKESGYRKPVHSGAIRQ